MSRPERGKMRGSEIPRSAPASVQALADTRLWPGGVQLEFGRKLAQLSRVV